MFKAELICAKLSVSFDRGTKRNAAADLGLDEVPVETKDGGLVRGLGSHWRSNEAKEKAKELSTIEGRVRREFARLFPMSNLPGIFVLPERGAGKKVVDEMEDVPNEISVHVTEFTMGILDTLPPVELEAWGERVKKQIAAVPLGRKEEADASGLDLIAKLAACPIFEDETRDELLRLIANARLDVIDRVTLKRSLATVAIKVGVAASPKRSVAAGGKVKVGENAAPRRAGASKKKKESA
jgi:hypothetical protein